MSPLAARLAVDIVLSQIGEDLARRERVTIRGFGTIATTRRAERVGRTPRTGERIGIPASTSVSFSVSRSIKDSVLSSGEPLPMNNGECVLAQLWSEVTNRERCEDND